MTDKLADAIDTWHEREFPNADLLAVGRQLVEEAGEVLEAIGRYEVAVLEGDPWLLHRATEQLLDELGDVGIASRRILRLVSATRILEVVTADRFEREIRHRRYASAREPQP